MSDFEIAETAARAASQQPTSPETVGRMVVRLVQYRRALAALMADRPSAELVAVLRGEMPQGGDR